MCNVEATDQGSLEDHFAGKKHIKNLQKSHVEKVHESKKPDTWIRGSGKFRCEICNVETSDQGQLDRYGNTGCEVFKWGYKIRKTFA